MVDINKTTLSVEFPILENFDDYHDIDDRADSLTKMFGKKISGAEIGFCEDSQYWGIFYVGRKPNKAAIKQLMADADFKPMFKPMYDDDEE